ncbi:S-layer homology domain-containing protein [Lutispora thermophila]|uniref:S-layer homology domain-containing protein n=1 Tax=Lutispora thermophila DSM 19022 TaxID=1122184 RepID=A0A1M6FEY2_9FIRM|nr:S-layer homology domain-containing protein [Lutispora thermophila]SHI96199.1 S-layer homology domain-containing protein [Lutispora thermophila DSM 19022]
MEKAVSILLTLTFILSSTIFVSADENFKTYGELLYDIGVISGSDGNINENGQITREEMVTVLIKISDKYIDFESYVPPKTPSFKDVPVSHWAYKNIEFALKNNITTGVGNGYFGLGQPITYNQASIFLIRSLNANLDGINYATAASEIKEKFKLSLSHEVAPNDPLKRGEVFELLAKTLNMDDYNLKVKKVETIGLDESKISMFNQNIGDVISYKDKANVSENVSNKTEKSANDEFPVDLLENISVDGFAPEEREEFIQILEERKLMKDLIGKYLAGKYMNISLKDFDSMFKDRDIKANGTIIDEYTREDVDYKYSVSRYKPTFFFMPEDNICAVTISYYEFGYDCNVKEIRKYETVDDTTPYALILRPVWYDELEDNDQNYVDSYLIVFHDKDDNVKTIFISPHCEGYFNEADNTN